NGPLVDEPHRKTRRPRRRAARRAATALGRATTLDEQPRRALDERPAERRPRTARLAPSPTGKPAAPDCARPGAPLRASAPPPPPPSTSSGPARRSGARPRHHPRRAAPACPRRAPSGCSATNGPLVDEPHRKTRRPRRRAARRAATALGRATTLDEQPRRALDE